MRGRPIRTWVKMHCQGCLSGSINYQLTLEEQAVWFKLIMYSAICGGDAGTIADNDNRPVPHWFIANEIHAPLEVLESTLKKCTTEGRIEENSTGLTITNFKQYQSEYERQKPSREARKAGKQIHKVCSTCGYKAVTNEEYCPRCAEKGESVSLDKDYFGGKYGHMIQH